jgi:hypothetical protein
MYSRLRATKPIRQDDGCVTATGRNRAANSPRTSWLTFAAVGRHRGELRFAGDNHGRLSCDRAAGL